MKRTIAAVLIILVALFALASYGLPWLTGAIAFAAAQPSAAAVPPAVAVAPKFAAVSELESAFQNIYTQVNPSIVRIDVVGRGTGALPPNRPDAPQVPPGRQQGLGSGFVWDTQGNIVTNNHVIAGATEISVTFADGTIVDGKVIGADPNSDLAVVKVDGPASLLRPVQVADSTNVQVGQLAIAIGNPFGQQNTMTTGIISAVGRSLPAGDRTLQGPTYSIPDVIQTDAPINPGNSGGVLLNAQGQVIGVTAAIDSSTGVSSGIGFAIPSTIVQKIVPVLIKSGRYDHPFIGISGSSLTPNIAKAMGLKPEQRGALVATVTANGPASKAGLRPSNQPATISGFQTLVGGDVIIAMDGKPVKTFDDLVAFLARSTQVNQTVTLTILREGKEQTVQVTLAARPGGS